MTEGTISAARIQQVLELVIVPLSWQTFRVIHGNEPHVAELRGGIWTCDCAEYALEPTVACDHLLAVYLHYQLSQPILGALRELAARCEGGI